MNVCFDLIVHPNFPQSFPFEKSLQTPDAEVLAEELFAFSEEFLVEFFADAESFSQELYVFSGELFAELLE